MRRFWLVLLDLLLALSLAATPCRTCLRLLGIPTPVPTLEMRPSAAVFASPVPTLHVDPARTPYPRPQSRD